MSAYPGARILHMVRDPRDRYSSSLKRWKVSRGGVGSGAAIWLNTITRANHYIKKYPKQYMAVRYEDLTSDPEGTLKQICDFIDEPYDEKMLTMEGAKKFRDKGGNSSYSQRKPGRITTSSIGKHKDVLSIYQIAYLQIFSKKTMQQFSYDLEKIEFSPLGWIRFALFVFPLNFAKMLAWLGREVYLNQVGRALPSERVVSKREAFI
jgi:hypothetical protein